jgi:uncharacterized protein
VIPTLALAEIQNAAVFLARSLVEKPEAVSTKLSEADGSHLLELSVDQDEVGKVIGRDGRTIHALRTVVLAAARETDANFRFELVDENGTAKKKKDRRRRRSSRGGNRAPAVADE